MQPISPHACISDIPPSSVNCFQTSQVLLTHASMSAITVRVITAWETWTRPSRMRQWISATFTATHGLAYRFITAAFQEEHKPQNIGKVVPLGIKEVFNFTWQHLPMLSRPTHMYTFIPRWRRQYHTSHLKSSPASCCLAAHRSSVCMHTPVKRWWLSAQPFRTTWLNQL